MEVKFKFEKETHLPVVKEIYGGENWEISDEACVTSVNSNLSENEVKEVEYWGNPFDNEYFNIHFQSDLLCYHHYDGKSEHIYENDEPCDIDDFLDDYCDKFKGARKEVHYEDPIEFIKKNNKATEAYVKEIKEEYAPEIMIEKPWHYIGKNGVVELGDLASLVKDMNDDDKIAIHFIDFIDEDDFKISLSKIDDEENEWDDDDHEIEDESDLGYLIFKVGDIRNSPTKGENVCISCIHNEYDTYGYFY